MRLETLDNFIVFEGLDGSGTTTQATRLAQSMASVGLRVWLTAEPTDGPIGRVIRDALNKVIRLERSTLARLYAADRNEHLDGPHGIVSRAKDEWIVCDRYLFSSFAYQTIDCDAEFVMSLNAGFPLPGHLFYIDVDPAECARRRSIREAEELFDAIEFQTAVHRRYRTVLDNFAGSERMKIVTIGGNDSADNIAAEIWSTLGFAPI